MENAATIRNNKGRCWKEWKNHFIGVFIENNGGHFEHFL
jgi:hypothetical protein